MKPTIMYNILVLAPKKYKGNYLDNAGLIPPTNDINLTTLLYK